MNRTPIWRLVAEREISTRLRDKAFLGATAFSLAVVVIAIVVTSILAGRPASYDVAVVGAPAQSVAAAAQTALRATGNHEDVVRPRVVADTAAAERLVRSGDAVAAVLASGQGFELVGRSEVDAGLQTALRAAVAQQVLTANAARQQVDLTALDRGTSASVRLLDAGPADAGARQGVALAFAILFFVTALGFGMQIAQSVVQEKESRVVEILAAAIPIRALLWGKIAGNTVLAIGQMVLTVGVGVVGLAVTGRGHLLAGIGPAVGWYLALFVLGFVSLASLWSVAGSMAARQQDLQATTLPGQLLLMVPYFVSVLGGDQLKTVFSMLPIVSTMTMPGRIAQGSVPLWQIGVAILSTVLAAVVFVRVGERVYERTLLHTGSRVGYREALSTAA
jgi:ABC-2 type transport system permease protein